MNQPTLSLPRLLRSLAILLFASSALIFLFQNWNDFDTIRRVLIFVGMITALSAFGVLSGGWWKDSATARVCLILATYLVPVSLSQFSALLYSTVGTTQRGPALFVLQTPNQSAANLALFASLLVLVPISYLGIRTATREKSLLLMIEFWIGNAFLLLPTREPESIGLLLLVWTSFILWNDIQYLSRERSLTITEGISIRWVIGVPPLLILLRSLILYDVTYVFISLFLALLGVANFFLAARSLQKEDHKQAAELIGACFFALSWICFSGGAFFREEQSGMVPLSLDYLVTVKLYPVAGILYALSLVSSSASVFRKMAICVGAGVALHDFLFIGGLVRSFLALMISIAVIVHGHLRNSQGLLYCGILSFLIVLASYSIRSLPLDSINPWVALCVAGVVLFGLATYFERGRGGE